MVFKHWLPKLKMENLNNRPKVVLLTGEIGSGKSAARKLFEQKGVPATDADGIAKEIQVPGSPCMVEIQKWFPSAVRADGTLNRAALREIIAADEKANEFLKEIMTPYVMDVLETWTMGHAGSMYVIWESALIHYGTPGVDRVCIVDAPSDVQLRRIKARNPDWTDEQIDGIIKQQRREIFKCNDVLYNGGSMEDLKWEVDHMHEAFDKLWEKKNESSTDIDG